MPHLSLSCVLLSLFFFAIISRDDHTNRLRLTHIISSCDFQRWRVRTRAIGPDYSTPIFTPTTVFDALGYTSPSFHHWWWYLCVCVWTARYIHTRSDILAIVTPFDKEYESPGRPSWQAFNVSMGHLTFCPDISYISTRVDYNSRPMG